MALKNLINSVGTYNAAILYIGRSLWSQMCGHTIQRVDRNHSSLRFIFKYFVEPTMHSYGIVIVRTARIEPTFLNSNEHLQPPLAALLLRFHCI